MNAVREEKVVRMEKWGSPERPFLAVIGWDLVADCGCLVREGMRLDRQEPVVGFTPCDEHRDEMSAMHRSYMDETMRREEFEEEGPDDERPLHEVLLERFRQAVG